MVSFFYQTSFGVLYNVQLPVNCTVITVLKDNVMHVNKLVVCSECANILFGFAEV